MTRQMQTVAAEHLRWGRYVDLSIGHDGHDIGISLEIRPRTRRCGVQLLEGAILWRCRAISWTATRQWRPPSPPATGPNRRWTCPWARKRDNPLFGRFARSKSTQYPANRLDRVTETCRSGVGGGGTHVRRRIRATATNYEGCGYKEHCRCQSLARKTWSVLDGSRDGTRALVAHLKRR